jgi:hypothetical protein
MNAISMTGNIFEDVAIKAPVRLASTVSNQVLNGQLTIDGVLTNIGDRVLVAAQLDQTTNGIWQVQSGPWTRPTDASSNTDFIDGTLVPVARGNANAGLMFQLLCTDSPIAIGTSMLVFIAQSQVAGGQSSGASSSSQTIGLGTKTFPVAAGLGFQALQYVLIYETSSVANIMLAQITSYAGTALVVSVVAISGIGTHSDWNIVLTGAPAAIGLQPPVGTGNVAGAGSSTAGNLPVFADTTGKVLADSGVARGTLAGRNTLLYGDAGTATIPQSALAPGAAPLPYVAAQPNDNLHLVNDGPNPTRDMDITPGRVRDDSDVTNLQLAGIMVKRLDVGWVAGGVTGSPAGGCDTGSKGAGQTWDAFLIGNLGHVVTAFSRSSNIATITVAAHGAGVGGTVRPSGIGVGFDAVAAITGVSTNTISYANTGPNVATTPVTAVVDLFDVLFSQSYSTPTLPVNWTVKQGLGSSLTDGSGNIRAVTQNGDQFEHSGAQTDAINTSSTGPISLTVPNGVAVEAMFAVTMTMPSGGGSIFVQPTGGGPGQSLGLLSVTGAGGAMGSGANSRVRVSTSRQVTVTPQTGVAYTWSTLGWRDPRRRLF